MIPLLLCAAAIAQQANATTEEVAAMIDDLLPRVARHAGRSFGPTAPDFAFSWSARLWPRIEAHLAEQLAEADPAFRAARLRAAREHVDGAVALYLEPEDRIYVLADGVYDLFEGARVDHAWFQPMLKCTLAHELTHALQRRHGALGREPSGPGRLLAVHAALEGHANWVAGQVCRELELEAALGLLDGGQGIYALQAQGPSMPVTALLYGASRAWMDQLHAAGGTEAQWAALADPPFVQEWLQPTLDALPPPRWTSPDVLVDATRRLSPGRWSFGAQGSIRAFGALEEEGWRAIPHLTASWAAVHQDGGASITLVALAFDHPDLPAALVDERWRLGAEPVPRGIQVRASARHPRLARLTWVDRVARFTGPGWAETWVARDDVLVVLWTEGDRVRERDAVDAIRAVLDGS